MSVPGSKTMTIDESPGSDFDRMTSTPSTPLSRSASSGTVISCSTSTAESPSASVCTSAYGGMNSGRTSAGGSRSSVTPRSEEHTSELQSRQYLVCRLLLEKKNTTSIT